MNDFDETVLEYYRQYKRRIFADKSPLLSPPSLNKPLSNETKPRSACCGACLEI